MNTTASIPYINFLRVMATVAVIFIHVGAMFQSSCELKSCENSYFQYEFIHRICSFAVPVFILISGSLLLNPKKEITYQSILHFAPLFNACIVVLFTFLLSYFVSCLLRQIPFLREKVL